MQDLIFYQLFEKESSTYTYLIADPMSREGIIIDPVIETFERDLQLVRQLDIQLKYILETHIHADHITGAAELRKKTGAKTAVCHRAGVNCADLMLKEGAEINFGKYSVYVYETPGHTNSCLSFLIGNLLFTGDALLIRGTGRTDFQQGSAAELFESIQKLFKLPDDTTVYPAHDYQGISKSTIGLEKKFNPRVGLGKTKQDFINIMNELKLANPKKMAEAVPANMACGQRSQTQA